MSEDAVPDYYAVLGLGRDADASEIKRAYRRIAVDTHPDTHGGDLEAEAKFKAAAEAYDVLGDPTKLARYQQELQLGKKLPPLRAQAAAPTVSERNAPLDSLSLDSAIAKANTIASSAVRGDRANVGGVRYVVEGTVAELYLTLNDAIVSDAEPAKVRAFLRDSVRVARDIEALKAQRKTATKSTVPLLNTMFPWDTVVVGTVTFRAVIVEGPMGTFGAYLERNGRILDVPPPGYTGPLADSSDYRMFSKEVADLERGIAQLRGVEAEALQKARDFNNWDGRDAFTVSGVVYSRQMVDTRLGAKATSTNLLCANGYPIDQRAREVADPQLRGARMDILTGFLRDHAAITKLSNELSDARSSVRDACVNVVWGTLMNNFGNYGSPPLEIGDFTDTDLGHYEVRKVEHMDYSDRVKTDKVLCLGDIVLTGFAKNFVDPGLRRVGATEAKAIVKDLRSNVVPRFWALKEQRKEAARQTKAAVRPANSGSPTAATTQADSRVPIEPETRTVTVRASRQGLPPDPEPSPTSPVQINTGPSKKQGRFSKWLNGGNNGPQGPNGNGASL